MAIIDTNCSAEGNETASAVADTALYVQCYLRIGMGLPILQCFKDVAPKTVKMKGEFKDSDICTIYIMVLFR